MTENLQQVEQRQVQQEVPRQEQPAQVENTDLRVNEEKEINDSCQTYFFWILIRICIFHHQFGWKIFWIMEIIRNFKKEGGGLLFQSNLKKWQRKVFKTQVILYFKFFYYVQMT